MITNIVFIYMHHKTHSMYESRAVINTFLCPVTSNFVLVFIRHIVLEFVQPHIFMSHCSSDHASRKMEILLSLFCKRLPHGGNSNMLINKNYSNLISMQYCIKTWLVYLRRYSPLKLSQFVRHKKLFLLFFISILHENAKFKS